MKCVICGQPIIGYGNNAEPVANGYCCDECNLDTVVPARIQQIYAEKNKEEGGERNVL